nr:hypothetical protein FNV92_13650 [Bradyrhizobium cosmicum]
MSGKTAIRGMRCSIHPSLRAQRSNPESLNGKTLDCFAAFAMTAWWDLRLAGTHGLSAAGANITSDISDTRRSTGRSA